MPGPDTAARHTSPGGEVISLARRARRKPPAGPPLKPEQLLASRIEALHASQGRTLTDPATAQSYDIAMHVATLVIEGVLMQEGLGDEPRERILGQLAAARAVPAIVDPDAAM